MSIEKISREEMKEEAIKRMRMLRLWAPCVRQFSKKESVIQFSEGMGALYDIDDSTEPSMLPAIREFEENTGSLVYHVIHGAYEFGECLTFLYVGPDKKLWESEQPDKNGYLEAYVDNLSDPGCSKDGTIQVCPSFGGLRRVM